MLVVDHRGHDPRRRRLDLTLARGAPSTVGVVHFSMFGLAYFYLFVDITCTALRHVRTIAIKQNLLRGFVHATGLSLRFG